MICVDSGSWPINVIIYEPVAIESAMQQYVNYVATRENNVICRNSHARSKRTKVTQHQSLHIFSKRESNFTEKPWSSRDFHLAWLVCTQSVWRSRGTERSSQIFIAKMFRDRKRMASPIEWETGRVSRHPSEKKTKGISLVNRENDYACVYVLFIQR